jgi:hypothetical protein
MNQWTAAGGVGSKAYKDWAPFDCKEIYRMFAILFVNAVSPKAQLAFWFLRSHTLGFFAMTALPKKLLGGRLINCEWCWSHFH